MQPKPNEDTEAEARPKGKAGAPKPPAGPRLPAAPGSPVGAGGAPTFGAFTGAMDMIRFDELGGTWARGKLWQLAHHKKWQYASFANAELAVAVAVFQASYVGRAFAYVFDRRARRFIAEREAMAVPQLQLKVGDRPSHGMSASFARGKTLSLSIGREVGSFLYLVKATWDGLEIAVELNTRKSGPSLTAVCPIEGGLLNVTQKSGPLPVSGHVIVDGTRFLFDGASAGFGALDYTSGLLAHETAWRWASGYGKVHEGPMVGLNLSTGFNEPREGTGENAIWIDGDLIPVGKAEIEFDTDLPDAPWRVRTADGAVNLEFRPEGTRRDRVDFKLVRSVYAQPVGTYHGELRTPEGKLFKLDGIPGVTEDHRARW